MSFYELLIDNLFVGESVKDISTVIYSLNKNISVFNIYFICYNEIKNNIEILSSNEFIKKRNENKYSNVFGIAGGKLEAYSLVRYIYQDVIDNKKDIKNLGDIFV